MAAATGHGLHAVLGELVQTTAGTPDDIAAQFADGRLDAKPSRVLSYKDIREAHHILEAAEAGKER